MFDVTRKITYKNLSSWYRELRQNRPDIPCILCANKIDGKMYSMWRAFNRTIHYVILYTCLVDYKVTEKSFNFARKNHLPFYFVSASDGTNVVKVNINWNIYLHDIVMHMHVVRYLKKPLKQQLLTKNTQQIF